ncbi:MAG: hypothetical protein HZA49_10295 [Planctomycetes bacterium]|nr:hypothetical protein [Planctomycetota bacterium]
MSEGYIDSASVYEIISFYRNDQPKEWYGWTWRGAVETTCAIINMQNLKMAPAPSRNEGPATGEYEHLTKSLSSTITHIKPNSEIQRLAINATKKWANKNTKRIVNVYGELKADRENFSKWINLAVKHAWVEHSKRLRGLFNAEFIPQLALILNIEKRELERIRRLSCDLKILKDYSNRIPNDSEFRTMWDCYIVSALIRGVYHDYVAKKSKYQIIHHPFRVPVLDKLNSSASSDYDISNTQNYFASIILASAYAEKTPNNRISCWAENVLKARNAMSYEYIDLPSKHHDTIALNLAVESARKIGIRTYSRRTEKILNIICDCGVGLLKMFTLNPWIAPTEIVLKETMEIRRLGTIVAGKVYGTEKKLSELGRSVPGRIETKW